MASTSRERDVNARAASRFSPSSSAKLRRVISTVALRGEPSVFGDTSVMVGNTRKSGAPCTVSCDVIVSDYEVVKT